MPFFLKVSGMEYINSQKDRNSYLNDNHIPLVDFTKLNIDEKLNEIYKLLLERN